MSDSAEDGEVFYSRMAVDDDPLLIQPPQRQAGSKHSSRTRQRKRSTERKHKHRRRDDEHRQRRRDRHDERSRSRHSRDGTHRSHKSKHESSPSSRDRSVLASSSYSSRHKLLADELDSVAPSSRHAANSRLESRVLPSEVTSLMAESHSAQRHSVRQISSVSSAEATYRVDRHGNVYSSHRRIDVSSDSLLPVGERRRERRAQHLSSPQSGPSSEVQLRRERCLQAVRESEYQKGVSRRELEARRQRRELMRQHDIEVRQIEQKRERESQVDSGGKSRFSRRREFDNEEHDSSISDDDAEDDEEHASSGIQSDKEMSPMESQSVNGKQSSSEDNDNNENESEDARSLSSSSSSSSNEKQRVVDDGGDDDEYNELSEGNADRSSDDEEGKTAQGPSSPTRHRWRTGSRSRSQTPLSEGNANPRSPSPVEVHQSPTEPSVVQRSPESPSPPPSPEEERLPPYFPAIQGCRNVEEFNCLNRIEEGTYGVVYRAIDKRTKEIVALKRLKMENEKEGFPITSLREINTLLKAQHENIVTVREIVVGSNMDKIYIVMDYVEHDLKSLMQTMKEKNQSFVTGEVKCLMVQMLRAVCHLHDNWILHRDLKTSNLLLSHRGILKVGDFGLAREYGSPLKSYTPIVVTLWYRAPELLLGTKMYACPIDLWSIGCIFGELVRMEPMFPGKSEADQINRIFKELGSPNDKIWPGYSELPAIRKMTFAEYPYNQLANRFGSSLTEKGLSLLNKLLTYDPRRRITADDALSHCYFDEQPRPIDPSMFPTWPAKSEVPHRKSGNSPKPPSGRKNIGDEDVGFQLGSVGVAGGGGFNLKF